MKQADTTLVRHATQKGQDRTYGLGEGTALANGNPVTLLDTESGGNVSSQVLVALLVTVVLGDVVEVFTADDEGTVHLGGHNTAGQDTATDGDETDEGALLVCGNCVSDLCGIVAATGDFRCLVFFRGWRKGMSRRLGIIVSLPSKMPSFVTFPFALSDRKFLSRPALWLHPNSTLEKRP